MNMFPMVVTMPNRDRHPEARMVYDGHDTLLWVWDHQAREPVLLAQLPGPPVGSGPTWLIKAPDGTISLARDTGCGCSHPLKRYTPQLTPGARRVYTTPPADVEVTDGV